MALRPLGPHLGAPWLGALSLGPGGSLAGARAPGTLPSLGSEAPEHLVNGRLVREGPVKRSGVPCWGSRQLSLPGTAPARGEPWGRCDGCGEALPIRAVLTCHTWELLAELSPPLRAPRDLEEGSSQDRYCAGCAAARWDSTAARLRAVGWRVRASRAVLVLLADLAARGSV